MDVKLFEILDTATFIPAMAVRLRNRTPEEFFLLRRAGYSAVAIGGPEERHGLLADGREPYVLLTRLSAGSPCQYDPYAWGDRTWRTAHAHILENWADLTSGDVVDVEFILGETAVKKKSEAEEMDALGRRR